MYVIFIAMRGVIIIIAVKIHSLKKIIQTALVENFDSTLHSIMYKQVWFFFKLPRYVIIVILFSEHILRCDMILLPSILC